MKKIHYKTEQKYDVGTPDHPEQITKLYDNETLCPDDRLEEILATVKAKAHNGEYTVVDVPDKPHDPTEVERLSSKLDAAIQSNAMLEECLVEMAGIVYA